MSPHYNKHNKVTNEKLRLAEDVYIQMLAEVELEGLNLVMETYRSYRLIHITRYRDTRGLIH